MNYITDDNLLYTYLVLLTVGDCFCYTTTQVLQATRLGAMMLYFFFYGW